MITDLGREVSLSEVRLRCVCVCVCVIPTLEGHALLSYLRP